MNPIIVPIGFTAVMLAAVYYDIRHEAGKYCHVAADWIALGCALMVKPGLLIAAVWVLFVSTFH